MTVLDILASTEINSLARGCVFSYRLSHILDYCSDYSESSDTIAIITTVTDILTLTPVTFLKVKVILRTISHLYYLKTP